MSGVNQEELYLAENLWVRHAPLPRRILMRKYILIIIVSQFFSACSDSSQIIHYEYSGVKINRLNRGKEVFFSRGYTNDKEKIIEDASVNVDYSFDDSLFGFLLFHKNGHVQIISSGGGDFKNLKKDNKLFFKSDSIPAYFSIRDYDNLYRIGSNIESEISRNNTAGSRVKIIP